jgi:hypothetical protein
MNNWRRFKEKVDVWVIRYSTEATLSYWGITNMLAPEAANVVKLMKVGALLTSCLGAANMPFEQGRPSHCLVQIKVMKEGWETLSAWP